MKAARSGALRTCRGVLSLVTMASMSGLAYGCFRIDDSCSGLSTCPVEDDDAGDAAATDSLETDSLSAVDTGRFCESGLCTPNALDGTGGIEADVDAGMPSSDGQGLLFDGATDRTVIPSDASNADSADTSVDVDGSTRETDGMNSSIDGGPDQTVTATSDAAVDALLAEATIDAGFCGNGHLDPGEQCDQGAANVANAYGQGRCTTQCTLAGYCGDGIVNGPEACDSGGAPIALGSCNPECTGFYVKKMVKLTSGYYSTNLGGISGADATCQTEFGAGWKALLVGGGRRASLTPFLADSPQDWVINKYTYYVNGQDQVIWRTDGVPLLGVASGTRQSLSAPAFDSGAGNYPWSGWASDWTTVPDSAENGTCLGWTSTSASYGGNFAATDLTLAASELCGSMAPILCVQQ